MKVGLLIAGLFFAGLTTTATADEAAANNITEAGVVKIEWQAPEKYRDVRSATENRAVYRQRVFEALTKSLDKNASKLLKSGEKLELVVTDLDLAGDVLPTFGAATVNEIRVVKQIYPPRISFSYRVLEGEQVIMVGSENLRDMGFMDHTSMNDSDSLRYEKAMLEAWLRKTVVPKA
ncbi:DUF3016 domain-containing protein [Shewanella avicenniae]|uniref:DUF3016 domain-containing protein n=1 Tax=Shewanella avicenniae TaxID=2814294 RepID=A0ABX7QPC9_9GAMM|nr:DUF3016 domain-containing protein [Shewanella avicenniae]QSX33327.1 DUF3016 domain-containing protein [Shewanella avicenniae]